MYLSRFAPVITFAASCIGSPAFAELPLAVEGFMTEKNKTRLDISMAYANVERSSVATGEPIIIQVGPTSFIGLPTAIGKRITNSDTLVATVGLRYGLTGRAETYVRSSYLSSWRRSSDSSGVRNDRGSRFTDAWAGISYQLKQDNDSPALIAFSETALREKHHKGSVSFKSALY